MGILYFSHLCEPTVRAYQCIQCSTDLALEKDFIFRDYLGSNRGEAYLFKEIVNVFYGPSETKLFTAGFFEGAQVFCKGCNKCIGWIYLKGEDLQTQLKENQVSIEVQCVKISCSSNTTPVNRSILTSYEQLVLQNESQATGLGTPVIPRIPYNWPYSTYSIAANSSSVN